MTDTLKQSIIEMITLLGIPDCEPKMKTGTQVGSLHSEHPGQNHLKRRPTEKNK